MPSRPNGVPQEAQLSVEDNEWYVVARDARRRKHGAATYWRADGTLVNRCAYEHDVPHGPYERYHENGEVSRRGTFEHGVLAGLEVRYRSSAPTSERAVEGLHPNVWRYELELAGGLIVTGRYYDREGARITSDGEPFPTERPAGVPADAAYMAATGLWFTGPVSLATGKMAGRWRHWSSDGVLVDDADYVEGARLQPCCPFEPIDAVLADHSLLDESYVRRLLERDEIRVVGRCREVISEATSMQWLTACRVLALLDEADGAAELVRRWDAGDGEERKRLLYVFANHEDGVTMLDQAVSHRLLAALDDDSLCAWAVEACGRGWGPGTAQRFVRLLERADVRAKRVAYWLLAKAPTAEHIAIVGRVARAAADDVRNDLAQSLGWVKGPMSAKAVDEIWSIVVDRDPLTCSSIVVEKLAKAPRPEMRGWFERLLASDAKRSLREPARLALLLLEADPIAALHGVLTAGLDHGDDFALAHAVEALTRIAAGSGNRKLVDALWALAERGAASGGTASTIAQAFAPADLVRVALTIEGTLSAARRAELTERLGLTARLRTWQNSAGWDVDEAAGEAPPLAATLSYDTCCSLAWQMRGTTREAVLAHVPEVDADVVAETRMAPDTFLRELVWHARGKLRPTAVRMVGDVLEYHHGGHLYQASCGEAWAHGDVLAMVNRALADAGVAERYLVYSECDTTEEWYPDPGTTWYWLADPIRLREHVLELPLPVFTAPLRTDG